MSETARRLEKAERYIQRGKPEAALKECLQALAEEPGHPAATHAAADLYLSLGHRSEAFSLLSEQFNREARAGHSDATSTYKKLAKVGAPTPDQALAAAPLLAKSSAKDAADAYYTALRGFTDAARSADAFAALQGVVALDPTAENYRHLGDLAQQLGETRAAVAAFLKAGGLAHSSGKPDAALLCYERVLALEPGQQDAALGYATLLLERPTATAADGEKAFALLEPLARPPQAPSEIRAACGRALLLAGRMREAIPYFNAVFDRFPALIDDIMRVIGRMLDAGQVGQAVEIARAVEQYHRHAGRFRDIIPAMRQLGDKQPARAVFLEYLVELFNAGNREHDYCETLLRLFDLYYAAGNFLKAGDCLDRAAEVDPYESGHRHRLELLKGKLDPSRMKLITARIAGAAAGPTEAAMTAPAPPPEAPGESTVLEDLMLQAEIFLQYSLRQRAVERLERVRKLFPGEELNNEKLRLLYENAGIAIAAPAPAPATAPAPALTPPPAIGADVQDFARITEIARNIYRQGSVKAVLFTAVNEAGRHWSASRCIAMLCTPGKPPAIALEYCAPGIKPSDVRELVKFMTSLQTLVVDHGPSAIGSSSPHTSLLKPFADTMGVSSVLSMPLLEGEQHIGLIVLAQVGSPRDWRPSDTTVLKTIADQIVLAVANARLRSLVKNLAVTEENSGLLKRTSYLDILVSETKRTLQQHSTMTLMLMNFGKASEALRHMGEEGVEGMMRQIGQLVCSHIRQNDLAVRYDPTTLALILADTSAQNALLAANKLRKLLANVSVPSLTVGIAQAALEPEYDPVDIVTELINRGEAALHQALRESPDDVCTLPPPESASVTAN